MYGDYNDQEQPIFEEGYSQYTITLADRSSYTAWTQIVTNNSVGAAYQVTVQNDSNQNPVAQNIVYLKEKKQSSPIIAAMYVMQCKDIVSITKNHQCTITDKQSKQTYNYSYTAGTGSNVANHTVTEQGTTCNSYSISANDIKNQLFQEEIKSHDDEDDESDYWEETPLSITIKRKTNQAGTSLLADDTKTVVYATAFFPNENDKSMKLFFTNSENTKIFDISDERLVTYNWNNEFNPKEKTKQLSNKYILALQLLIENKQLQNEDIICFTEVYYTTSFKYNTFTGNKHTLTMCNAWGNPIGSTAIDIPIIKLTKETQPLLSPAQKYRLQNGLFNATKGIALLSLTGFGGFYLIAAATSISVNTAAAATGGIVAFSSTAGLPLFPLIMLAVFTGSVIALEIQSYLFPKKPDDPPASIPRHSGEDSEYNSIGELSS